MKIISCACIGILSFATSVSATTFSFTATQVSTTVDGVAVGATIYDEAVAFTSISGTLTIDSTPTGGMFFGGVVYQEPTLTLNEFTAPVVDSRLSPFSILFNDQLFTDGTTSDALFSASGGLGGIPDGPLSTFTFSLFDRTQTVFDASFALPSVLSASQFSLGTLSLSGTQVEGGRNIGSETVNFQFDGLTPFVPQVPLPASMLLLLAGFGAIGVLARRRGSKDQSLAGT